MSTQNKKEEAEFKALYEQYVNWKQSQQGQSDGYAYEESFANFCQQLNKQLLELAINSDDTSAKKKYKPDLEK